MDARGLAEWGQNLAFLKALPGPGSAPATLASHRSTPGGAAKACSAPAWQLPGPRSGGPRQPADSVISVMGRTIGMVLLCDPVPTASGWASCESAQSGSGRAGFAGVTRMRRCSSVPVLQQGRRIQNPRNRHQQPFLVHLGPSWVSRNWNTWIRWKLVSRVFHASRAEVAGTRGVFSLKYLKCDSSVP